MRPIFYPYQVLMLLAFAFPAVVLAQAKTDDQTLPWQGKKAAVVLTYDDAIAQQLDHAIPLLDSLDLKGTFYVTPFFAGFKKNLKAWRQAAQNGHELGNHTLFHPCDGSLPGRGWVDKNYDLSSYSMTRILDEINLASVMLEAVDGLRERTFAFTCSDIKAGDSLFADSLRISFIAARAVRQEMLSIKDIDLFNIAGYMINGQDGAELITLVEKAKKNNALLVFLFHGVGGGHELDVSLLAHRQLLHYLKDHSDEIWTVPLIEAARHIQKQRM